MSIQSNLYITVNLGMWSGDPCTQVAIKLPWKSMIGTLSNEDGDADDDGKEQL